jgi:hypothetical protein
MTHGSLPPDRDLSDDDVLAALRRVPRPAPTAAETAAGARALEAALAADVVARRRAVSPLAVAAGLMFAAVAASAGTVLSLRALSSTDASQPPPSSPSMASSTSTRSALAIPEGPTPTLDTRREPSSSTTSPALTAPPSTSTQDSVVAAPAPAPPSPKKRPSSKKALTWQEQADQLGAAGDVRAAAVVAARAFVGDNDADVRAAQVLLWGLVGRDPRVVDVLDAAATDVDVDDDAVGRALRLSCELRLRYLRDATAVTTCRAFGQRFPSHPAARPLAFGAGGLAEELGDLRGAVDEYSRAVVLAPLSGSMASEALFARARVRARLGDLDEARADLRVFLRADPRPLDAHSDEVRGLARALRL